MHNIAYQDGQRITKKHFWTILRVLLENLEYNEGSTRAQLFGVLTEMLRQESLEDGFHGFTELVMQKAPELIKSPVLQPWLGAPSRDGGQSAQPHC